MVGLAGSSSLLLFARSGAGSNPFNPSDLNTKNPLPTSCSSPDFHALNNAKGQDPCQVAWDLLPGPCFDANSITPGELPPSDQLHNNQCLCNTVFFSLVYVCERCTTMQPWAPSWGVYSSALQCTTKPINGFLNYNEPDIPPDTAIPSWAYQPLDDDGTVDIQQATSSPVAPIQSQSSPPPPGPDSTAGSSSPTTTSTPPPSTPFSSGTDTASSPSVSVSSISPGIRTSSPSPSTTSTLTSGNLESSVSKTSPLYNVSSGNQVPAPTVNSHTSTAPDKASAAPSELASGTPSVSGAAAALPSNRRSDIGAIVGGVFGGIVAVILAICIFFCLARRRRRRREKEAMLASGPLDWWRQTDILPRLMKREPSESSTIKADDLDYDDDMETLHAMSVEKKSVTYGEYPDL